MGKALWGNWIALWNGDLSESSNILAPDLKVHAALFGEVDEAGVQGASGLVGWIHLLRKLLGEPTFTVEVGPIVDGEFLCGRWYAEGRYAGGMPGATAEPGAPVAFAGTDILRVENGQIAEYWINSDVHVMAAQLGMAG